MKYGRSTEYWLQDGFEYNNSTKLRKSLGAYAISTFRIMVQQKQEAASNRGGQCCFRRSRPTFMDVGWNPSPGQSPNPATSTWTRQVAVCSPPHPLGFPEVDASSLFDHMEATMAGWSVPARSEPPAAGGGAAAAWAASGPASSSVVSAQPPPPPPTSRHALRAAQRGLDF